MSTLIGSLLESEGETLCGKCFFLAVRSSPPLMGPERLQAPVSAVVKVFAPVVSMEIINHGQAGKDTDY